MNNQQKSDPGHENLFSDNLRLIILAFTFPVSLVLGVYGYLHYHSGDEPVGFFNALYHTAQLYILHSPHFGPPVPLSLEIARWLAALSTLLALVNTAIYLFRYEWMEVKIKQSKKHTIVCGIGRRGITIVEKLHKTNNDIVAIDKHPEPEIAERLHKLGIPLIIGDATRTEILERARAKNASKVYALCPDDTINLSVALAAQKIKTGHNSNWECIIHINDTELRNSLQTNHQGNPFVAGQNLRFTDTYGAEAIRLIVHGLPLDHNGIAPDDKRQVHLVILGFGCMGQTIAVKAAQLGQFANRKRLQISVIDRNAAENQAALFFHHPYIGEVADFSFYPQEVLSPVTRSLTEKWCNNAEMLVNLVICFDNPSLAYDVLFNLLPVIQRKNINVGIRINELESFDFLMNVAGIKNNSNFHIVPFGFEKGFESLIYPDKDEAEKFAVDIHAAYTGVIRDECKNDPVKLKEKEESGELNPWEKLNEDFRESNRQQAMHMYFKTRPPVTK
jgi:voltage-gated potassium channel Kch